jgi:hypothetical protein
MNYCKIILTALGGRKTPQSELMRRQNAHLYVKEEFVATRRKIFL